MPGSEIDRGLRSMQQDAKRFYDWFGARQDWQFYERAPIEKLFADSEFETASAVFELGCGTGRLAQRLLEKHLPKNASYKGVDISTTMVSVATKRLYPWRSRAKILEANGGAGLSYSGAAFDRFIVTYVFDLLPAETIRSVLRDAHRVLRPRGKLCAVVSSEGVNVISRMISWTWMRLYAISPGWAGGCRPLQMAYFLDRK